MEIAFDLFLLLPPPALPPAPQLQALLGVLLALEFKGICSDISNDGKILYNLK
jgi:hypothetical protein